MIKTSRILSIILTLIIASASWTGAKAQEAGDHVIVNGIHFLINGFGTATVTNTQYLDEDYGYYTNTVQIPSTITVEGETYTVTGIQEKAFYSCPELKNVQIQAQSALLAHRHLARVQLFHISSLTQQTKISMQTRIAYCSTRLRQS